MALFVNVSVMVVVFGLFMVVFLGSTDPLGGKVDYSHTGVVHISMSRYVEDLCNTFKQAQLNLDGGFIEVKKRSRSLTQLTAAPKNLFVVNEECEPLSDAACKDRESLCYHRNANILLRRRPIQCL